MVIAKRIVFPHLRMLQLVIAKRIVFPHLPNNTKQHNKLRLPNTQRMLQPLAKQQNHRTAKKQNHRSRKLTLTLTLY